MTIDSETAGMRGVAFMDGRWVPLAETDEIFISSAAGGIMPVTPTTAGRSATESPAR